MFRQAAADLRAAEIERSGSEEEASVVADTVQVDPSGLQLGIAHVERDLPDVVTGSLRQELDAHRHAAAGWNGAPRRLHQARPAELGSTRDDVRLAEDAVLGTGIEQLETLRRRMEDVLQPEIKGGRRVDGHLARPQDPSQRGERNLLDPLRRRQAGEMCERDGHKGRDRQSEHMLHGGHPRLRSYCGLGGTG